MVARTTWGVDDLRAINPTPARLANLVAKGEVTKRVAAEYRRSKATPRPKYAYTTRKQLAEKGVDVKQLCDLVAAHEVSKSLARAYLTDLALFEIHRDATSDVGLRIAGMEAVA